MMPCTYTMYCIFAISEESCIFVVAKMGCMRIMALIAKVIDNKLHPAIKKFSVSKHIVG